MHSVPERTSWLFSVRGLGFDYGSRPVLSGLDFDIATGGSTAFAGPNGSGKTTTLKLLNGLLGPHSGTILFEGRPLAGNRALRQRTLYLHQHPVLFAGTVWSNMAFALRLKQIGGDCLRQRIADTAHNFSIEHLLSREAAALSGGETQRVALARAAAVGADVLLLDEPTASLDRASKASLLDLLGRLRTEGYTLLFSSHDADVLRALADMVLELDRGRLADRTVSALGYGQPESGLDSGGKTGEP